jgi:hypothetical protein
MINFSDIAIGQQLYAVYNDSRLGDPFLVTVEKRVRGDIIASGVRFKVWNYDGFAIGYSDLSKKIKLYLSQEDYEAKLAWVKFSLDADKQQLTKEQRLRILAIISE